MRTPRHGGGEGQRLDGGLVPPRSPGRAIQPGGGGLKALEALRARGRRVLIRLRERAAGPLRILAGPLRFARRLGHDDAAGLSAELAYRFFLALFPFVIVLATIAAGAARALGVTDPSAEIIRAFGAAMPDEVADLVGGELRRVVERQTPALVSFGAVAALLVATGGTNTVFKALRRAFGVTEPRPAWRTYLLAVTLTLLAGSLTVLVAVLVLGLQAVGAEASASVGLEAMWRAALVLRWPVAVPLLTLAAGVLFRYGTVQRPGWRAIAGGSLFFAAGWLVFTYLFVLYVDVVAGYGATYGALGGVAGLLVWLYCSAFVLVVGAEITASLHGSRAGEVEAAAAGSAPAPAHD